MLEWTSAMDIKTPIEHEGARPARASAAAAVCVLAALAALEPPQARAQIPVPATTPQQMAVLMHERLTGVPPSPANLTTMANYIAGQQYQNAAALALQQPQFYNVILKNMFLPATNRDQSVFVPLNDYVVTAIGMIHDNIPFNTALSADILYTLSASGLPPPSPGDNNHYATADANNVDISANLRKTTQSAVYPGIAPAGLITTRASTSAFFINGTNRAMFRFTLINHLCRDMEQVQDITRPTDQIRQDVATSPGGDSRVYLNTCIGCHSGMDPMARAFAYYNFNATTNLTEYTPGKVNAKYFINSANDKFGFVTPDDTWSNRWIAGSNAVPLGFAAGPHTGSGAASLGQELANSDAFADCQVQKAFKAVCLRAPANSTDTAAVAAIKTRFESNNYNMQQVFADTAIYCTVTGTPPTG
jgi:hypothetical protein